MACWQLVILAAVTAAHASTVMEKRIIGGSKVVLGEFGFAGSLQQFLDGEWTHVCGCTRKLSNVFVSAAHCTNGSDISTFRAVFDTLDLTDLSPPAQITSITSTYVLGSFTRNGPGYKLDYSELNVVNSNITIPGSQDFLLNNVTVTNLTGEQCSIVGFGEGKMLMSKTVTVISTAECVQRLTGTGATITERDEICIDGHSITAGDSGTSLVCGGEFVGVASWSYVPCPGTSVFVRLSSPILDD
ncbi:chymotrypsin-like serine proteinase [Haliotis rufescens]|uniref:chymotrypsin-like serine proteinase n=1 Tax=Haliotis rufescens TaxID=6454 RepID=UPI001EB06572|nr:chymotrypsin-like serine proteinase [Haliotis rufescens]